jgi:Regulator of chromosome condensation (RCC1) repeat
MRHGFLPALALALAAGAVLLAVTSMPSKSDAHSFSDEPILLSRAASAGGHQSCGLRTDGTVVCWGDNGHGEATPPAGAFSQVSAGAMHTCGLKPDGTLACWGDNAYGQATPPTGTFRQVSAGYGHTCGLKTDGTAVCWGDNSFGQATPLAGAFSQVSAGYVHTCGLRADGTVICWGNDSYGQTAVPTGTFSQVSAGYGHTCGLRADGTLACWGDNRYGQATAPTGTFSQIGAGYGHTCGLKTDGTVVCWGDNFYAQSSPPTGTFSHVSAGYWHNCGVRTDGALACWGYGGDGRSAPPSGTIVIVKATDPTGGTGFGFSDNIATPNSFSLDDGGTKVFGNVFTDSYIVIEDDPQVNPGNFGLSGLTCVDPDGGSDVDLSARKATIDLDAGETVTCVFTNTRALTPTPTNTPTASATPTATSTPRPTPTPCGPDGDGDSMPQCFEELHTCLDPQAADGQVDPDADSLTNLDEYLLGIDPCLYDTDNDGCADGEEPVGAPVHSPGSTGAYDPLAWYDFYDVPVGANADPAPNGLRDKSVTMSDVLAVLLYVGAYDGDFGHLNSNRVAYDSVKGSCDWNADTTPDKEGLCYDRSPSLEPNPPWDAGPPDDAVTMSDVLAALAQVGLSCIGPP